MFMKHRFLAKRYWKDITTPMGEVALLAHRHPDLINLSLGDPDYITDNIIIEGALADAKKGHTRYTDPQGYLELREEIAAFYEEEYKCAVTPEEIMIVVGACHGMYLVLEAILDEGDEVIVPAPYFTPYDLQIKLAKGNPVILETYEEDGFQIDTERLKSLITNRTKALIINTPNNPTGASLSSKTMEEVAKVAIEQDLLIIADDIYGAFSFKEPFFPMLSIPGMKERTITIGSFSKDYAMTGWRMGYVIAPDFITACIRDINEGVCFASPSVSQRAALYALRNRKDIQPPMIEEYKKRVFYAYERICKIPNMSILEPQGSFYLFVNIKKTGLSSTEVVKKMLAESHVLTIPGHAFGACGEGYIRIACTVGVEQLKEVFDRLEKMDIFSE